MVAPSNQQQQMHGQQSHDQRKQAPSSNNPHPRRKYTVEYGNSNTNINNNTNSLNQNQNQNQNQNPHQSSNTNSSNDSIVQGTKSMSWTNSSQHKKSTASVAVTATPTSNVNSNAGKQYSHSRTYTNQHHHHHSQQSQNNYSQPQTRGHSGMKGPSSPIAAAPPNGDRKHSQGDQIPKVSTSTATTNIINNINNSAVVTQITTSVGSNSSPHNIPPSQNSSNNEVNALSNKQYPGFANKKQAIATATTLDTPPATAVTAPTINLAPPIPAVTSSTNTGSTWASLFINKNSITSNTAVSASAQTISSTSLDKSNDSPALPPPFSSKKPIAKVAPYDGNNSVVAQITLPIVTPGTMSYSAASAQGLLNTATIGQCANASRSTKTQSTVTTQAVPRRNSAHLDEWSQKYADHLVKYKTELSNVSLRPRGLTNRSNYCYINSILQALMGCSPFYNLIRSIPKQAATLCDVKTPTINAMISLMSNFSTLPSGQRLRTNNKNSKGKDDLGVELQCDPSFEPTEIYKLWNESREEHSEGRQEDAEEFLGYVLNKLNDEMLEVVKLIAKPATTNGQNDQNENDDGDAWQMICNNRNKGSITRQTDFGRTPLSDIFRGELRSRLQREGEHSTDDIQPFFTLQLNIEKAASVKEALEILVGRDQLEGVTGSKTKQEVVAWQQMTLEKLPTILILHLKWFDYKSDGCTKILKKVDFPVELKIDTKILASKKYSQKQRAYRLFAVVYHDGKEASKGHYITDVYHTGYNSWLRFDDSTVKPVNENHVLYPHIPRVPYLLYYRRCDTLPHTTATANNANTNSSSGSRASDGK
ncbi:ubiquitin carboxyl-terminal hydrolase 10 [Teleopsis dalmanni]|uniref:ubiquitin carboxyl-terminal hydrolase 10 n=1 Tax=Teleopsis dalmanni TaxID=139649 RepID=UPI0018CD041B|nr:ubiquitin carboxyl-terminal hydrolase 10 [Teleopsis dalmanni]